MPRKTFIPILLLSYIGYQYKYNFNTSCSSLELKIFDQMSCLNPKSTGLYKRSLSKSIPLESFFQSFFQSNLYKLELYLSDCKENPKEFILQLDHQLGHLKVESILPQEQTVILHYQYEKEFDYRLFLAVKENHLYAGFINYLDDYQQDWGSRVYIRLLLESAARKLSR